MNQYSESLLAIPYSNFGGWSWRDLCKISSELFYAFILLEPENVGSGEWLEQKCTFLCFIIAMSDQDLYECFGLPLPASPAASSLKKESSNV